MAGKVVDLAILSVDCIPLFGHLSTEIAVSDVDAALKTVMPRSASSLFPQH
jgi:hypothetical protein